MLDSLRKGAGTWIAKLFIALLIFSFAIWGVTDFLQGYGQNTVAKVGEKEVSLLEFDRMYRQDLNRLGQQFGRPLTPQEGASLGIPQQALARLIGQAAMSNAAQELKVGISDDRLGAIIQSDPAFQGASGRYDRSRLQQVLNANDYREDEYVILRRQEAERSQVIEGLIGGMSAPQTYLAAFDAFQNETRSVEYIAIAAEQIGDIEDPAEDALVTYYDGKKADFRAPEYREIKYVELVPSALARPEDITDADARSEYDRRISDFAEPERRRVRQLSFNSDEDAQDASEALTAGKTFADLMADRNLTNNDVTLGVMSRADFLDDAIGDAAFGLSAGETSDVVDGRFSNVIVNVEEIIPANTTPFADVRDEIVEELALEQAEREILDLLDEIEDARAGGALLDEIGERFSLAVKSTGSFDREGKTTIETDAILPDAEGLIAGAFDSDIGIENDVLQIGNRGYLWYDVTSVTPERDRDLDEVRDQVIAAWKSDQLNERLSQKATDLLTKAESGTSLGDLAAAEGVTVQTAEGVTRSVPTGDLGRDALTAIFEGPAGSVATAETADGNGRVVLKVTGSEIPEFNPETSEVTALEGQLSQQVQNSLLDLFVAEQETRAGVDINSAAVAQVMGLNPDGTAHSGSGM
ncbi:SurA N-terminal domain-containing protein [Roseibium sp. MB-4]